MHPEAAARMREMAPEELLDAAAAEEAEGAPRRGAQRNPLLEFFRTMFVPERAERGGGLRREMNRQNAPEGGPHEN